MTADDRIKSLESQVRTLKRLFLGAACLLMAGIAVAATSMQGVPDVIRAKQFRVVNDDEDVVASLRTDAFGDGELVVQNKDRSAAASLGAAQHGGALAIFNKKGKVVAGLWVASNGGGLLTITDKERKPVATLPELSTSN